jgi:uncharacterized protein (DUF1330 family)
MDFVDPTKEQFQAFRALPRTGVIHMLNLVRLRKSASYPDGRSASGEEAYRTYAEAIAPMLTKVGGKFHWVGRFEQTLIGPPGESWDHVFIVEYPSADAFLAMLRDPAYTEAVQHRQAAVEDSRLIRISPGDPSSLYSPAR